MNDKDIVVNVDNAGGDATLKFEKAVNSKVINAGDSHRIQRCGGSFTKEPYMLTLTIDDPEGKHQRSARKRFLGRSREEGRVKKAVPKAAVKKKAG